MNEPLANGNVDDRRVFSDAGLDSSYQEAGMLTFPLLGTKDVSDLVHGYRDSGESAGFHTTLYSGSANYRREMDSLISGVVDEKLESLLEGYEVVVRQFAVKLPNDPTGVVGPHQDWSITDERSHQPLVVWIALADVDRESGAIWLVPRSHRIAPGVRTNSSKDDYYCPLQSVAMALREKHGRFVPLGAGQAVAYHPATVHGSDIHRGDIARLAVIVGCLPRSAPRRHYFRHQRRVDVYDVGDQFFLDDVRLQAPPTNLAPSRSYMSERAAVNMDDVRASGVLPV